MPSPAANYDANVMAVESLQRIRAAEADLLKAEQAEEAALEDLRQKRKRREAARGFLHDVIKQECDPTPTLFDAKEHLRPQPKEK